MGIVQLQLALSIMRSQQQALAEQQALARQRNRSGSVAATHCMGTGFLSWQHQGVHFPGMGSLEGTVRALSQ